MKCFHCKINIDGEPVLDLGKGKIPNFTLHERCARMLFGLPDEPKIDFTHLVGPDVRAMADSFKQYLNYNKGDVIVVDSVFSERATSSLLSSKHMNVYTEILVKQQENENITNNVAQFKRDKFDRLNQGKCSKVAPSKFFRGLTNA